MFGLSPMELMMFAAIALLLFGKRLPGAMRSMGEGIRGFKEELRGVGQSVTEDALPRSAALQQPQAQ